MPRPVIGWAASAASNIASIRSRDACARPRGAIRPDIAKAAHLIRSPPGSPALVQAATALPNAQPLPVGEMEGNAPLLGGRAMLRKTFPIIGIGAHSHDNSPRRPNSN